MFPSVFNYTHTHIPYTYCYICFLLNFITLILLALFYWLTAVLLYQRAFNRNGQQHPTVAFLSHLCWGAFSVTLYGCVCGRLRLFAVYCVCLFAFAFAFAFTFTFTFVFSFAFTFTFAFAVCIYIHRYDLLCAFALCLRKYSLRSPTFMAFRVIFIVSRLFLRRLFIW